MSAGLAFLGLAAFFFFLAFDDNDVCHRRVVFVVAHLIRHDTSGQLLGLFLGNPCLGVVGLGPLDDVVGKGFCKGGWRRRCQDRCHHCQRGRQHLGGCVLCAAVGGAIAICIPATTNANTAVCCPSKGLPWSKANKASLLSSSAIPRSVVVSWSWK